MTPLYSLRRSIKCWTALRFDRGGLAPGAMANPKPSRFSVNSTGVGAENARLLWLRIPSPGRGLLKESASVHFHHGSRDLTDDYRAHSWESVGRRGGPPALRITLLARSEAFPTRESWPITVAPRDDLNSGRRRSPAPSKGGGASRQAWQRRTRSSSLWTPTPPIMRSQLWPQRRRMSGRLRRRS